MDTPKILILQDRLSSYNLPLYNLISKNFDLTVSSVFVDKSNQNIEFRFNQLQRIKVGPFCFIKNNFFRYCKNFDVVIFSPDLHYISFSIIPFLKHNYKTIAWTIGIRASYTNRYDINRPKKILDKIFGKVLKKSDALIFYMKEPIKYWESEFATNKIFVAHNTVEVKNIENKTHNKEKRILFVGTLYKEKKIYELLNAFLDAKKVYPNDLVLDIVGDGIEFSYIKNYIKSNNLHEHIIIHGAIFDEDRLSNLFINSLLCISPDQAGLTVLKSMGYGIPFVTRRNAITGGERLNIIDKINGLFYDDYSELIDIIIKSAKDPNYFVQLGINAKMYYNNYATINHMTTGFKEAIKFVLK
jgi:glycosyltransferase involved in cell wall biosynthesis